MFMSRQEDNFGCHSSDVNLRFGLGRSKCMIHGADPIHIQSIRLCSIPLNKIINLVKKQNTWLKVKILDAFIIKYYKALGTGSNYKKRIMAKDKTNCKGLDIYLASYYI